MSNPNRKQVGDGPVWGFNDFNTYALHGLLGMRLRSKTVASPSQPPSTTAALRELLEETVVWAMELGFSPRKLEHALASANLQELLPTLPDLWAGEGR